MMVVQMATILHAIINPGITRILEIGKMSLAKIISLKAAADKVQHHIHQVCMHTPMAQSLVVAHCGAQNVTRENETVQMISCLDGFSSYF